MSYRKTRTPILSIVACASALFVFCFASLGVTFVSVEPGMPAVLYALGIATAIAGLFVMFVVADGVQS